MPTKRNIAEGYTITCYMNNFVYPPTDATFYQGQCILYSDPECRKLMGSMANNIIVKDNDYIINTAVINIDRLVMCANMYMPKDFFSSVNKPLYGNGIASKTGNLIGMTMVNNKRGIITMTLVYGNKICGF